MPEAATKTSNVSSGRGHKQGAFKDKDKPTEIRMSNIIAAKGLLPSRCRKFHIRFNLSVTVDKKIPILQLLRMP